MDTPLRILWSLVAVIALGHLADILSTELVIWMGVGEEANPIILKLGKPAAYSLKILHAALSAVLVLWFQRKNYLTWIAIIFYAAMSITLWTVVVNNLMILA